MLVSPTEKDLCVSQSHWKGHGLRVSQSQWKGHGLCVSQSQWKKCGHVVCLSVASGGGVTNFALLCSQPRILCGIIKSWTYRESHILSKGVINKPDLWNNTAASTKPYTLTSFLRQSFLNHWHTLRHIPVRHVPHSLLNQAPKRSSLSLTLSLARSLSLEVMEFNFMTKQTEILHKHTCFGPTGRD